MSFAPHRELRSEALGQYARLMIARNARQKRRQPRCLLAVLVFRERARVLRFGRSSGDVWRGAGGRVAVPVARRRKGPNQPLRALGGERVRF